MSRPQLALFDLPVTGPAPVSESLQRLAAKLSASLYLGTSSWYFPGWAGIVYDTRASESDLAREGLSAYAQHPLLRSVSLDRAFYQPLSREQYAQYAGQVPASFRFVAKAWRNLTDPIIEGKPNAQFLDPRVATQQVITPFAEGCGDKAGAVVFQFSPGLPRKARLTPQTFALRLREFLRALSTTVPLAVEVRDRELLTEDYFVALSAGGAVHCPNVHPTMPGVLDQGQIAPTQGPLIVRWMLQGGFAYEEARARYAPFDRLVDEDAATRRHIATLCRAALDAGRPVYVIANNKAEGCAPLTLFKLAERLCSSPAAPVAMR